MRFLSADLIFPICANPIPNGILAVSANGTIKDLMLLDDDRAPDPSRIERFDGVLCPGFVNAHCHLELSHMRGLVPEKTGLPAFIMQIVSRRHEKADEKMEAIRLANEEMWQNGIQAVGDICNTTDTLETKRNSRIKYHSFVEVFSFDSSKADLVLDEGVRVATEYQRNGLIATVVPHAPYSVSERLFDGIRRQQNQFPGAISIHNQETESENEMFVSGSGELVEIFRKFGEDFSNFKPRFDSSLHYHLHQLPKDQPIVLVHNTMTKAAEFDVVRLQRNDVFWCTCPQANKYIENQIPNLPMWFERKAKICVGTDSLASNHQLSILEELKLIQSIYAQINLSDLLKMASLNGAKALCLDKQIGSFEIGKTPGILWIRGQEITQGMLTEDCAVQRIF